MGLDKPNNPSRIRWILGFVRINPCSAISNALHFPPGKYVHKNETQRN